MKKSNVILQAAIASALLAMAGSASAVTSISGASVAYATEQFLGSAPYTATVVPAFTVSTGTNIPSGSIVTVAVELANATFTAANASSVAATAPGGQPAGSMGVTSAVYFGSTLANTTTVAPGAAAPTATAANANVYLVQLTTSASSSIGVGGTLFTIPALSISTNALASTAGTVTATATVYTTALTPPVGTAVTGTVLDAASTRTLATSTAGNTITAAANTSTSKIDLTATTASSKFTQVAASTTETNSTTVFKLGTVTMTDNAAKKVTDGTTAYTMAAATGGAKTAVVTLNGPAGFFGALGTAGTITLRGPNTTACAGAASATSATFTLAASATAATSVTLPAATAATSGQAADVCMAVNGTTAMITGTPTVTVVLGASAAQDAADTLTAAAMQALDTNGQTKYVRNYIPAAVTGFTEVVRISNTGSMAAVPTITMHSESGAQIGTSFVGASLAAGATRRYTQAQIEAGVGATATTLLATDRPRLTVTSPTNGLDVQTLMLSNGVYTSLSGTE